MRSGGGRVGLHSHQQCKLMEGNAQSGWSPLEGSLLEFYMGAGTPSPLGLLLEPCRPQETEGVTGQKGRGDRHKLTRASSK